MTMALPIPAQQMEEYKRTARARWQAEQVRVAARRDRAWRWAHEAAALLKQQYGVTRVVVFGSLLPERRFHSQSDVDLAVWGLTSKNWLKAIGAAYDLSDEIEVNAVDVECCSPALLEVIEREGIEL